MNALSKFARDDAGLETVEYAIMAGLIVAASVALIVALGGWVKNTYSTFQKELK
jgi:Flp pilus assembly pilin Flp